MKEALLVVDMQNQLIEEGPYQLIEMVEGIQKLIANFRERKQPVIFVRHNGLGCHLAVEIGKFTQACLHKRVKKLLIKPLIVPLKRLT
ncbi:isochorismatase family protein [Streptococcus parauberis]|uniref:isochorismatase family protein n=1 Tax=Streptococcus parauberis TaxID=1348 RepID=UPI0003163CDC|nr:isochorismatase family protein [Streptococcus parauberis]UWM90671.1 isochorismatase family protein [Streptococcus parauberis]WEM62832.1 isochorismatase family protein [Streptococcus parauberis]GAJ62429.1 isochorismatase hydrolase [Streptococcus parauberis]